MVAKLGEPADQQIEFVEVYSPIGAVLMFEGFERLERGVNIAVRKAIVTVEEVLPSSPSIALCSF